jgi:biopolymer transport protein ExbD
MAMSDTTKRAIEEEVKLDMTPMIDVTFLLLTFFMLTMKFRVLEGKLDAQLPKDMGQAAGGAPVDREKVRIRIQVIKEKVHPPQLFNMVSKRMSYEKFAQAFKAETGNEFKFQDTTFAMRFSVGNAPIFDMIQKTTFTSGQPTTTYGYFKPATTTPMPDAVGELERKLKTARGSMKEAVPVIIDPDRSATYAALTLALHAATNAEFKEIQFAGKISEQ